MSNPLIEDYAMIGDCETAALVGRDGSIDWLCWPRFDSDACFAKLLGTEENGRWLLTSLDPSVKTSRRYLPDTLVLETRYESPEGVVTVTDFMPPRGRNSDVVRVVKGVSGRMKMTTRLTLRFGYGWIVPWVTRLEDGTLRAVAGPDMVVLHAPAELHGEGMATVADFTVSAGESVPFVLTYTASNGPLPEPVDPQAAFDDTVAFWTEWTGRFKPDALDGSGQLPEPWVEPVKRSLIILKALTYAPSGGIVAAATTSLPEKIGGERNWDYRYCWLRDASITLFALMSGGYYEEAEAWRDWLIRAMAGSVDQLQIMYGVLGERRLLEWEADWLTGFEGSKPVRIGNAAHAQLQLDVYGEVMSLLHRARLGGLPESDAAWSLQVAMLGQLEQLWHKPDSGLWESRAAPQHYTFSKAMVWLAFDRGIKSAEKFELADAPLDKWRAIRQEIHEQVCREGYNTELGTFVQHYGSTDLDASLLLLPATGFLEADDPRLVGTVEAIERELLVDGFVLRYKTHAGADGLPPGEGAFLACSFWLAECYALIGRVDEARDMVERLMALANDVGLLSEEYDPQAKRQLGNTPQAFSHVTMVAAAFRVGQAIAAREGGKEKPSAAQAEMAQG